MKGLRSAFILGLIATAMMSRLLPHPPNCTAMNAVALFGASVLGNLWITLGVLFASMFLSDLLLGFHSTMPFVYASFSLAILYGYFFKCRTSHSAKLWGSLAASCTFFLVANFGVWMVTSYYSKTVEGLLACYIAALPFFTNQLFGDLFYTLLIFGAFSLLERLAFHKNTLFFHHGR